jgi:hypothetical protein
MQNGHENIKAGPSVYHAARSHQSRERSPLTRPREQGEAVACQGSVEKNGLFFRPLT